MDSQNKSELQMPFATNSARTLNESSSPGSVSAALLVKILFSITYILIGALVIPSGITQEPGSQNERVLPNTLPGVVDFSTPFDLDGSNSRYESSIEFRAESSIESGDRRAIGLGSQTIQKKASLSGFDLDQTGWKYQQIICPAFPKHLVLLFSLNSGIGDVSKFTAILSRDGNGSVRIIPIMRRSYSLVPAAPSNPLTIAMFNQLRAEEHSEKRLNWLSMGLCYAALTGSRVELSGQMDGQSKSSIQLVSSSLLQVSENGAAVVHFVDVEVPQRPSAWDVNFNSDGRLISVVVTSAPELRTTLLRSEHTTLVPNGPDQDTHSVE